MEDPGCAGVRQKVASVLIDIGFLAVVLPVLVFTVVGFGGAWLIYRPVQDSCIDPCDGPAMAAFSGAVLLLLLLWLAYWPVFGMWLGRTLGCRLTGTRYSGDGLRRHLVSDKPKTEQ